MDVSRHGFASKRQIQCQENFLTRRLIYFAVQIEQLRARASPVATLLARGRAQAGKLLENARAVGALSGGSRRVSTSLDPTLKGNFGIGFVPIFAMPLAIMIMGPSRLPSGGVRRGHFSCLGS
jgi:hypothetical protein